MKTKFEFSSLTLKTGWFNKTRFIGANVCVTRAERRICSPLEGSHWLILGKFGQNNSNKNNGRSSSCFNSYYSVKPEPFLPDWRKKTDLEMKKLVSNLMIESKYETNSTWLQTVFFPWHHPTKPGVRM